ncbi:MAG: penicillin-binding transpeptidase domain-containing protein [Myxococcota bacterium]
MASSNAAALDWASAVQAEAATLEAEYPDGTVQIVVFDASGDTVLASHGDIDQATPTGSTMKSLTIYAALAEGLDPSITLDASQPVVVDGHEIYDAHDNGVLTLPQAVARSSNIALARVLQATPWKAVYARVAAMVPLPESGDESLGVAVGLLDGFSSEVPLHDLVRAYAKMGAAPDGEPVLDMLRGAVGPDGTGDQAVVPGLDVLGKTGTSGEPGSRVAVFVGRVSDGETTAWIGVSVLGAGKGGFGGSVSAPAFARIVKTVFERP